MPEKSLVGVPLKVQNVRCADTDTGARTRQHLNIHTDFLLDSVVGQCFKLHGVKLATVK